MPREPETDERDVETIPGVAVEEATPKDDPQEIAEPNEPA